MYEIISNIYLFCLRLLFKEEGVLIISIYIWEIFLFDKNNEAHFPKKKTDFSMRTTEMRHYLRYYYINASQSYSGLQT